MSSRRPTQPRLLLPALGPVPPEPADGLPSGTADNETWAGSDLHLQRGKVKLRACNSCRRRKIKCNGQRPRCRTCTRRRIDCDYDSDEDESESAGTARKRKHSEPDGSASNPFEDVYRSLATLPRVQADNMLNTIRTGADPETVLQLCTPAHLRKTPGRGTLPASEGQDGDDLHPDASIELMDHLHLTPDFISWSNLEQLGTTNGQVNALGASIRGEALPPQHSEAEMASSSVRPIPTALELDLTSQDPTINPMLDPDLGFCLYDTLIAREDLEYG